MFIDITGGPITRTKAGFYTGPIPEVGDQITAEVSLVNQRPGDPKVPRILRVVGVDEDTSTITAVIIGIPEEEEAA